MLQQAQVVARNTESVAVIRAGEHLGGGPVRALCFLEVARAGEQLAAAIEHPADPGLLVRRRVGVCRKLQRAVSGFVVAEAYLQRAGGVDGVAAAKGVTRL